MTEDQQFPTQALVALATVPSDLLAALKKEALLPHLGVMAEPVSVCGGPPVERRNAPLAIGKWLRRNRHDPVVVTDWAWWDLINATASGTLGDAAQDWRDRVAVVVIGDPPARAMNYAPVQVLTVAPGSAGSEVGRALRNEIARKRASARRGVFWVVDDSPARFEVGDTDYYRRSLDKAVTVAGVRCIVSHVGEVRDAARVLRDFQECIVAPAAAKSTPVHAVLDNHIPPYWDFGAHLQIWLKQAGLTAKLCSSLGSTPAGAADLLTAGTALEVLAELERKELRAIIVEPNQVDLAELSANPETQDWHGVVYADPAMGAIVRKATRVAMSRVPVLLRGESGSGKERFANAIHKQSDRTGTFVAINCANIVESLAESELFGHVDNAYTGAKRRNGAFVTADRGSLLLDEVGELPLEIQAKLLRVIQEGSVTPVGADRPSLVDVRLLCGTHRDLEGMVKAGTFRQDLYFRISGFQILIPPLRSRRCDIPVLARTFLDRHRDHKNLNPSALVELLEHEWPGNVRELETIVGLLCLFSDGTNIDGVDVAAVINTESVKPRPDRVADASTRFVDLAVRLVAVDASCATVLSERVLKQDEPVIRRDVLSVVRGAHESKQLRQTVREWFGWKPWHDEDEKPDCSRFWADLGVDASVAAAYADAWRSILSARADPEPPGAPPPAPPRPALASAPAKPSAEPPAAPGSSSRSRAPTPPAISTLHSGSVLADPPVFLRPDAVKAAIEACADIPGFPLKGWSHAAESGDALHFLVDLIQAAPGERDDNYDAAQVNGMRQLRSWLAAWTAKDANSKEPGEGVVQFVKGRMAEFRDAYVQKARVKPDTARKAVARLNRYFCRLATPEPQ